MVLEMVWRSLVFEETVKKSVVVLEWSERIRRCGGLGRVSDGSCPFGRFRELAPLCEEYEDVDDGWRCSVILSKVCCFALEN